jgi:hypothetical protein
MAYSFRCRIRHPPKQRPEEGKATYTGDMMLAHRVAAPFENTIFERSDKDIE